MTKATGLLAVLHIPHSADSIPADLREAVLLSDADLAQELAVMTDHYTDELFTSTSTAATPLRFPVSRLVMDPERYLDDTLEPMAAQGMGVIYERTSDGKRLRAPPTAAERSSLISRFYEPHHKALSAAIERVLMESGTCLLLDCHSFPSAPISCDLDQMTDRPDFCLGTDPNATPGWLVEKAQEFLGSCGFTVEINRPYSGVLVPERYSRDDSDVHALMIEVNRRLYMDEQTGNRRADFDIVAGTIRELVRNLINETRARTQRAGAYEGDTENGKGN